MPQAVHPFYPALPNHNLQPFRAFPSTPRDNRSTFLVGQSARTKGMHMAKDKKISDLPGISQAAIMGLSRSGIVTMNDMVNADFDKVAYLLEDYNEATRLLKEARKAVEQQQSRRSRNSQPEPPPPPMSEIPAPLTQRIVNDEVQEVRPARPEPVRLDAARPSKPLRIPAPPPSDGPFQQALSFATRGLRIDDSPGRQAAAKRMSVAGLLLRYGASESDIITALILEPAEAGTISADEAATKFGPKVEKTLEECASLRAVPLLPSGKLPRYYLDMARSASLSARRVCAAYIPYLSEGPSGVSAQVYGRLLCEALEAGGPDELISACRAALESGVKMAA